jgi:hypothetical protein
VEPRVQFVEAVQHLEGVDQQAGQVPQAVLRTPAEDALFDVVQRQARAGDGETASAEKAHEPQRTLVEPRPLGEEALGARVVAVQPERKRRVVVLPDPAQVGLVEIRERREVGVRVVAGPVGDQQLLGGLGRAQVRNPGRRRRLLGRVAAGVRVGVGHGCGHVRDVGQTGKKGSPRWWNRCIGRHGDGLGSERTHAG